MTMHEIIKEFNEARKYWVLSCPEGCRITYWKEGDDIMKYTSFEKVFCPQNANLSIYHCVSAEDDEKYMAEQLRLIEEMEEQNNAD